MLKMFSFWVLYFEYVHLLMGVLLSQELPSGFHFIIMFSWVLQMECRQQFCSYGNQEKRNCTQKIFILNAYKRKKQWSFFRTKASSALRGLSRRKKYLFCIGWYHSSLQSQGAIKSPVLFSYTTPKLVMSSCQEVRGKTLGRFHLPCICASLY